MNRSLITALLLVLATVANASAQEWAKKLFQTHSHDFGTVARGSKTVYEFEIENIYDLTRELAKAKPGQTVKITVRRGDQTVETSATLIERK